MHYFQLAKVQRYLDVCRWYPLLELLSNLLSEPFVALISDEGVGWFVDSDIQWFELVCKVMWDDNNLVKILLAKI